MKDFENVNLGLLMLIHHSFNMEILCIIKVNTKSERLKKTYILFTYNKILRSSAYVRLG